VSKSSKIHRTPREDEVYLHMLVNCSVKDLYNSRYDGRFPESWLEVVVIVTGIKGYKKMWKITAY
jgi:hypothetical protein